MIIRTDRRAGLLPALALFLAGCQGGQAPTTARPATQPTTQPEAKHSHERGKMLLADVGEEYHALLTAHLAPTGNELDIFFETTDSKAPAPAAIPLTAFTAHATVAGEEQPHELKFEPAPADERPKGEKPGTCSHFVAKAPWMKPTDTLTVVAQLTINGERYRVAWEKFNPKKYAHHEE